MNKKLCFIFGTRPEIIKLAPVIKEAIKQGVPFLTIHTGQHYSEKMDEVFFKNLDLPKADYNLAVGSGTHATQTAAMLVGIEKILLEEQPSVVIVQGDTNSVLAGALVAAKLNIPVAHVEAGLRSYDNTMPEEINRKITGVTAKYHFVPTDDAYNNLVKEGVEEKAIFKVGNTVTDAVLQNIEIATNNSKIIQTLELDNKKYVLVTIHRPENTDNPEKMNIITDTLLAIAAKNIEVIWPIHPRTKKQLESLNLDKQLLEADKIKIIEPLDYFDMLVLQSKAVALVTDSGGLQEESCILGTPCITVRNNTERPESVAVGANILTGCDQEKIMSTLKDLMSSEKKRWTNPFGDGTTSKQIIEVITTDN